MTHATASRLQLHQYIDKADDQEIETLLNYIKKELSKEKNKTYDKWDDPDFINTLERRTKALEDGTDKGFTWEEVKQRARKSFKQK